jgi:hypothetical protein
MSHFDKKSLSFYGIAISSVLLLFKVVSTYGENKLHAAPNINGQYELVDSQNLPDCLQEKKLTLNIEQSGIYLFGNLTVAGLADKQKTIEIPLSGDFKEPEIIVSGKGNIDGCNSPLQLAIQGQKQNNTLVGKIQETASGTESLFTANYQPQAKSESSKNH